MPLKDNEKNVDYKARLEKKLYLARENPEPIFDLSDCNLKTVPNNIFSLCRVFRKDALYLQKNKLTSLSGGGDLEELALLSLMDISSNNFKKLPNDLSPLINLKILNISQNQIKELPETIGNLQNLLHLNASINQLKSLPETIGECKSLEYLNIEGNNDLKSLPTSLAKLHCLNELIIGSNIIYPPPEICKGGVKVILRFLAEECGEHYEFECNLDKKEPLKENFPLIDGFNVLQVEYLHQEKVKMLEKMKEEKQKELLALEEQLSDENRKQYFIQQSLKDKRKELITVLKNQQQSLDEEIARVQENKESQRALLIKECNNVEENANLKIKGILEYNNALKMRLAKISEESKKEEEEYLLGLQQNVIETVKPLEKAALLASMNELLREEIKRFENNSNDKRINFVQAIVTEDKKNFDNLMKFLRLSDKNQSELIHKISEDEKLQRSAVTSLIERNDTQLWQIRNQVASIQSQLLVLTQVELTRKRLEAKTNLVELCKSRMALTELLMELFRQQTERRKELIESLRRVENAKDGKSETFWLEQYKKLLNSKSQQLVDRLKKIDPELAGELFLFGVFHYLPLIDDLFSEEDFNLENLTAEQLSDVGVTDEDDQAQILNAIDSYLRKRKIPSAPPAIVPSAPLVSPSCSNDCKTFFQHNEECVICMDAKSEVIFIPCGHVCCCSKCCESISNCPLCRTSIQHILQLTTPSNGGSLK